MSSLLAQPTIVPLTEELNSELLWFDGTIGSALCEESFRLVEDTATTFDGPLAFPTGQLLPSFGDDHLGPPPAQSEDGERIHFAEFTANMCNVPPSVRPEDL